MMLITSVVTEQDQKQDYTYGRAFSSRLLLKEFNSNAAVDVTVTQLEESRLLCAASLSAATPANGRFLLRDSNQELQIRQMRNRRR